MSYITKNGITIDTEEELRARAANLGLSKEEFEDQYIADNGVVDDDEEDFQTDPQKQGAAVDPTKPAPGNTDSNGGEGSSDGSDGDEGFGWRDVAGAVWNVAKTSVTLGSSLGVSSLVNPSDESLDSYKKREAKRKSDPKWIEENKSITAAAAQWLSSKQNVKNVIGDTPANWDHLDRKTRGNEDLYNDLAKAVKAQFKIEGSSLSLKDLDFIVRDVVSSKANVQRTKEALEKEKEKNDYIIEQDLTDEAVEATQLNSTIKSLPPQKQELALAQRKMEDMRKAGINSPEDKQAIKAQESVVQGLMEGLDTWHSSPKRFTDYNGAAIGTALEGTEDANTGFTYTEEEIKDILQKVAETGADSDMTQAGHNKRLFDDNSRDLFYHNEKGKEIMSITSNDHGAWRALLAMGYKSTGRNKQGFTFDVKLDDLAKHYETFVNDGHVAGRFADYDVETTTAEDLERLGVSTTRELGGFSSKRGYFGLTENAEGAKDATFWEQINPFGDTEFRPDDKDRNAKLEIRDFRDNKKTIIGERGVLTDMHVLNINPATKTEGWMEDGLDAVVRMAEVIVDGGAQESEQWAGTGAVDVNWSDRKSKDLVQSMQDKYGGIVNTEEMKEEIRRSGVYEVVEGVAGFVMPLIEFGLINAAANKAGLITGIPKIVNRAIRASKIAKDGKAGMAISKTANFTGHALWEEVKMAIAFDEHYHMGGGVGFYSVGKLLGKLKFTNNSNLIKTMVNVHGKPGVAGWISVPLAANLEAAIRDLAGNEDYMTYVQDTYFDENLEFHLGKHAKGGLIDFFVFSLLGIKGFATKEGRMAYRPTEGKKIGNVTWLKGLKDLQAESVKVLNEAGRKLETIDTLLESKVRGQFRNEFVLNGKTYDRAGLEARKGAIIKESGKFRDLFAGSTAKIRELGISNDWGDDVKAKKMVETQFAGIKHLFGEDLKIVTSKDSNKLQGEGMGDWEAAAEYDVKENTIYINTSKASAGKLPHEIVHVAMVKIFEKNPALAQKFKNILAPIFDKHMITVMEKSKSNGKEYEKQVSLSTFINMEYAKKGKDIKNHEYVAYAVEILSDPRSYSRLVNVGAFTSAENGIRDFAGKHGIKDFDISTKDQLIKFMGGFAESIKSGTLTKNQLSKLQNIEKTKLFENEPNNYDATLPRERARIETEKAFSSKTVKEQSNKVQENYRGLRDKGVTGDALAERLTRPTGKEGSVAGENFDAIVYNVIDNYNAGRVRKGFEEQQITDKGDRYMMATELVYHLSVKDGNKSRGLREVIKDYEARPDFVQRTKDQNGDVKESFVMYDKYGDQKLGAERIAELEAKYKANRSTPEFKAAAIADGYAGKQNLTKTIMQTLKLRIFELKGTSIDAGTTDGDVYQTISMDASPEVRTMVENQSGTGFTDFSAPAVEQVKKKITLDGREYSYPVKVKDAFGLNTEAYNVKVAEIVDFLPMEKLSFQNIGEMMKSDISIDLQKNAGLDPAMKPKEYVDRAREYFANKEELAFEAIPKTSNPEMYEASNVGKTTFSPLFKKTGEKFKTSELPDWLAKETNARTFKFEKVDYKKGELNSILFSGRDAGVMKKKILEYFNQLSKVGSSQITRDNLSKPNIQDFIKSKDLSKFHNLKVANVMPYIKEAIRGATPDNFQSTAKEIGVWDKWESKWKKMEFGKYNSIMHALDDSKKSFTLKDQKVLDEHWSILTGEKGYNIDSKENIALLQSWTESKRNLEQLKHGAIVPSAWKDFKAINADLITILREQGVSEEGLNRLTINETKPTRIKDSEKYFEFVNDFMDTIDPRLRSIVGSSYGSGKYEFNNEDFKKVDYMFTSLGKGEKLPFNPAHIKTVTNGIFKRAFMAELEKADTSTPEKIEEFADMIKEKYLIPKLTAKRKGELAKELKNGEITQKEYDAAVKPVTYRQVVEANEKAQEYLYTKLFDHYNKSTDKVNAINQIQFFLQLQSNIEDGLSRSLATHTAVTTIKGEMYSEHELQVMNFNGNFLINMVKNSGSKANFLENFRPIAKQFKQSIIPREVQQIIDSPENDGRTGSVYSKGHTTDLPAKAEFLRLEDMLERTIDLESGKTFKHLIEIENGASQTLDAVRAIRKKLQAKLPMQSKTMNNASIVKKLAEIDVALGLARKRNKVKKGISVFDFDDTLAKSNSHVIYTLPNGKKGRINATEFAGSSAALEAKGAKFDFSEFNKVLEGKKGPLFDLAQKRAGKFGTGDIFVLTARPQASAGAIHKFLKSIGLEIPLKNITGLENGTADAKALWILEKASKGYNDFYFADDAPKNVKAVEDVLNVIDVKSKVQIAYSSKDLNMDINNMIERATGIGKDKVYSEFKAKLTGKDAGKIKLMSSSAQDFEGLLYRLYGKGKQGNEDMAWVKENLQKPFSRANNAISTDRVRMFNDFKQMKNDLTKSGVPKNLKENIAGEPFSIEQAVRVHTWDKQGMKIDGVSKADLKVMVDFVEKNTALLKFGQQLIDLGLGEGYAEPGRNWEAGTITTDLLKGLNNNRRAKYLEQSGWTENVETVFSKENLNKMEAGLGSNWRTAMDNMLMRMKTGRNRPGSGKESELENMALDWLNNSTGAIMFLNTKSAVLQTISAVNYMNWSDNNPIQAGMAMGKNPKQWAKTFSELFMSDFMVERRGGLKINVNESEIADAARQGGAKGVIATILKKGFVFTQLADSFAIASGGASFYINRVKTYEKQGLSKAEAKEKAFVDFRELTEESQQSSRADRISQQQASGLGRVVLAFANTPSQYARLMQKAASDIKNGRGDLKTNISKLMYYGFVQNAIFNALQTALFRDAFDDEEGIQTDVSYMANGMVDSILRGMGWQGAAMATVKGIIQDVHKQSKKKRPKYSDSALKLLDIAPPLDSKISKLRQAGRTFEYDLDEVKSSGFSLDNPAYLAGAQVVSATTNIPIDRLFKKYNNIEAALKEDTENWEAVALALGWSEWSIGMDGKDNVSAKEFVREVFSRETFERETFKRE